MNRVDVKSTHRFPISLVRELVEFARDGREHGHVALNVKNSRHAYRGRAYSRIPSISSRRGGHARYLVVSAVGADDQFPVRNMSYRGLKTAPKYDLVDAVEAIVKLTAHELTHCQQFKQRTPLSEIHADTSALRTLARFREARLEGRLPVLAAWEMEQVDLLLAPQPVKLPRAPRVRVKLPEAETVLHPQTIRAMVGRGLPDDLAAHLGTLPSEVNEILRSHVLRTTDWTWTDDAGNLYLDGLKASVLRRLAEHPRVDVHDGRVCVSSALQCPECGMLECECASERQAV